LEVLPQIPSNSVDLIFTDPPYGISKEVKITRGRNPMKFSGKDIDLDFGEWDKFDSEGDYWNFTFSWVDKCIRVLRKGGIFSTYFDRDKISILSYYLQSKDFKLKGYYADLKSNPVPQARKVKWMNGWEEIGLWKKKGGELTYNWELGQQKDYGMRPILQGEERTDHPTQKPLRVARLFVSYWSEEGDLVLDPFVGSGTTAVASKKLGRKFIGIESKKEYVKIARERLGKTKRQKRICLQ